MIRIRERTTAFQIDVDGQSGDDSIELDRRAARLARDRYHDHLDRIYAGPPAELEGTITWLMLPRGNRVWKAFRGYFLHAKVEILLSENPQPVHRGCDVGPAIDGMLARLCDAHDVEYHVTSESGSTEREQGPGSALDAFENRFPQHEDTVASIRRWVIYLLFVALRPFIVNLYTMVRESVIVRFWVHPTLPDRDRFFDAPATLNSGRRRAGYACYDGTITDGVRAFLSHTVETTRQAFDPDHPVPVEWFAEPADFRRAIELAPHVAELTRLTGKRASERSTSPDFRLLAAQLETVSTDAVFRALLLESAVDGFADEVSDDVWTHTQNLSKFLPRLLSVVGERADVDTVAVANHYISETRITDGFTDREIHGPESVILPDLFVVWEDRSSAALRDQGIAADKVEIARDKVEAEARDLDEGYEIREPATANTATSTGTGNDRQVRVFVPLQETSDDVGLSAALEHVSNSLPNVTFVLKPHPYFTPHDSLLELLDDDNFVMTAADTSFADVIEVCDVCVSVYSTATFPALARAVPVVWAPFASPTHFFMDLIGEVGIQTADAEELADAIERLALDETFYEKEARECAEFADRELVPDADAPSLAEVLVEADPSR